MTELTTQPTRHGPKAGLRKPGKGRSSTPWPLRSRQDFGKLYPKLTIQKFTQPVKCYRLVWQFANKMWLCRENQIAHDRVNGKGGIVEAGEALAGLLKVEFKP